MTNLMTRAEETGRDVARVVGEKAEQLRGATSDVVTHPVRSVQRHPAQWGIVLGAAAVTALVVAAAALRRRYMA